MSKENSLPDDICHHSGAKLRQSGKMQRDKNGKFKKKSDIGNINFAKNLDQYSAESIEKALEQQPNGDLERGRQEGYKDGRIEGYRNGYKDGEAARCLDPHNNFNQSQLADHGEAEFMRGYVVGRSNLPRSMGGFEVLAFVFLAVITGVFYSYLVFHLASIDPELFLHMGRIVKSFF